MESQAATAITHRQGDIMRTRIGLIALPLAALLASCGSDSTGAPLPDNTVASVSISPSSVADLEVNLTQVFTATARNAAGTDLTGVAFTWTTSDASILTLTATTGSSVTGTAVKAGSATVGASASSKSASVSLNVIAAAAATVAAADFTFTPVTATIHAGESVKWTGLSTHNVVFKTPGAPTDIGMVGTGSRTFSTPGTYDYVCGPHESLGMKGQVVVLP
jgi:plastocyanin